MPSHPRNHPWATRADHAIGVPRLQPNPDLSELGPSSPEQFPPRIEARAGSGPRAGSDLPARPGSPAGPGGDAGSEPGQGSDSPASARPSAGPEGDAGFEHHADFEPHAGLESHAGPESDADVEAEVGSGPHPVPESSTTLAPRLRGDQAGSVATEYGLLAVVVATIVSVLIEWATGGGISDLLDAVLNEVSDLVGL